MIEIVVFFANAAVLALEVVGGRSFTPYFGSSAEVWAGILAIVLAGLAIGYQAGGKLADRAKDEKRLRELLAGTLAGAGIAIAATWMAADSFAVVGTAVAEKAGLTVGAAAAALLLLFPASILLAAVSPIAAKIRIRSLEASATVIGKLSAIAAIGSVAGAFATGIILIPNVGSKESLVGLGISLIILAILLSAGTKRTRMLVMLVVFLGALTLSHTFFVSDASGMVQGKLVADIDTKYSRILIFDTEHEKGEQYLRLVRTGPSSTQCGALMKGDSPTDASETPIFNYTRAFDAAFRVIPNPNRLLIIGGCNYSYPRHAHILAPRAVIDVVELDPAMTKAAEEWFGFIRPPHMNIFHADGRTFLNETAHTGREHYDIAFIDAYNSLLSIPHQLMTEEAFAKLKSLLAPGGIVTFNIIGSFEGSGAAYLASVIATLEQSFTHVEVFRIGSKPPEIAQNIIVIASTDDAGKEALRNAIASDGTLTLDAYGLTLHGVPKEEMAPDRVLVLTDNYAPVEALTKPLRNQ